MTKRCECSPQYVVVTRIWLDNEYKLEPGEIVDPKKDKVFFNIWLKEGWIKAVFPYEENCRSSAEQVLKNEQNYSNIDSDENEIVRECYNFISSYNDDMNEYNDTCNGLIFEKPQESMKVLYDKYRGK